MEPSVAVDETSGTKKKSHDRAVGRGEFIALLAGLMALNALAIDILLPAFPNIVDDFTLIDENQVQFVILSYVVGFGAGQLLFGPISDRFGRRTPLFLGLALYIGCVLAAVIAPSFNTLLLARMVQGIGAAATRIVALAVVRDTCSGRQMASTMSLIMMVFMIVPILAPFLGQGVIMIADWHMIFVLMAMIAMVMAVWGFWRLPETLDPANRRSLRPAVIVEGFGFVLSNRVSLFYALASAFYFGSLFGFLNSASQIYVGLYGLGNWFPVAFAGVAVLMAASSFLNSRLVTRFGQRRLSHSALIAFIVLSSLTAVVSANGPLPFWLFMILFSLIMSLFGWVGANFNSIAMEPLGHVAGTASSTLGFAQTVGGGIVGALIGQAFDGTILPLALGYVVVSTISLICVLIAEKGRLFGTIADATA